LFFLNSVPIYHTNQKRFWSEYTTYIVKLDTYYLRLQKTGIRGFSGMTKNLWTILTNRYLRVSINHTFNESKVFSSSRNCFRAIVFDYLYTWFIKYLIWRFDNTLLCRWYYYFNIWSWKRWSSEYRSAVH